MTNTKINKLDSKGYKTGLWKEYDENGRIINIRKY